MNYNINHFKDKIKSFWLEYKEEFFVCIIIIMVGLASFNLGILSVKNNHSAIEIRNSEGIIEEEILDFNNSNSVRNQINFSATTTNIVASKNGKAYYFTNCLGSLRISEQNKIYFTSEEDAIKAGYYLAVNCKRSN